MWCTQRWILELFPPRCSSTLESIKPCSVNSLLSPKPQLTALHTAMVLTASPRGQDLLELAVRFGLDTLGWAGTFLSVFTADVVAYLIGMVDGLINQTGNRSENHLSAECKLDQFTKEKYFVLCHNRAMLCLDSIFSRDLESWHYLWALSMDCVQFRYIVDSTLG